MSRHRRVALILMAAGLLSVGGSLAGLYAVTSRPAVQVTHADPHAQPPTPASARDQATPVATPQASGYAASRPVQQRPSQPRTGVWIEIPSLRISLPIREGDGRGDTAPQWQALHFPGTAKPGTPGNSYLYAHGLWGMFGALLYARRGDEVDVHDYGTAQIQRLHVSRVVGRIHWNDTSWIHYRSDRPTLTLQTCVDDDQHGDRFIVQAT
ncbi:MAG: sortase [Candidatus Dormibacteraeota bacterium]|nr:sortase [Candidatus Dormibacteraeota bacterium]